MTGVDSHTFEEQSAGDQALNGKDKISLTIKERNCTRVHIEIMQ